MKEELKKLFNEFEKDVHTHNRQKAEGLKPHLALEDDVEITMESFIRWLNFK